jgi:hypothetical protein
LPISGACPTPLSVPHHFAICAGVRLTARTIVSPSISARPPQAQIRRRSQLLNSKRHVVGYLRARGGQSARHRYAANSCSSAFASFRSRVSNPSVNHP